MSSRRWLALALISVAQFMLILDVTVVNVALPSIATDLSLSREALTWVVTAYTLVFGGLMLLGGRLADVFGARRIMFTGLIVFTAASLVSGLADSGAVLIAARIAQGTGAALLSPAALATITTMFHGPERNKALGVWAGIGGIGSAAGVLVGGMLTAGPGWEWIFFVNVPVGLAVLATLPLAVPRMEASGQPGIDLPGALLVTTATGALIYGLVRAGDLGWTAPVTAASGAAAIFLYTLFTVVERRTRTPLMDVRMLTRRPVIAGAFLMLIATALLISLFFLGSVYLQRVLGNSAMTTGLIFLPVAISTGMGAHLGSRLVGRFGGRPVAVTGLTAGAAGLWLLSGLSTSDDIWSGLMPGFILAAAGIGATFVAATTTALGFIEPGESGLASGVVNTFHEVGGSVGVAIASALAAAGLQANTISGYPLAFSVGAMSSLAAAVIAWRLIPAGRPQLSGVPHAH